MIPAGCNALQGLFCHAELAALRFARRLAEFRNGFLISTRDGDEFADLIRAIGFLSNSDFSAEAIRELLLAGGS